MNNGTGDMQGVLLFGIKSSSDLQQYHSREQYSQAWTHTVLIPITKRSEIAFKMPLITH